jgi:hypothetical protein
MAVVPPVRPFIQIVASLIAVAEPVGHTDRSAMEVELVARAQVEGAAVGCSYHERRGRVRERARRSYRRQCQLVHDEPPDVR